MMSILTETYTLNNGINIPKVGFGTWQIPNGDVAYRAVSEALEAGYRHIDTALVYGNEKSVGRAIANSGIPRSELFVTTKLPAQTKERVGVVDAFNRSLDNLDMPYVDLYLIHAPWPWSMPGVRYDKQNLVAWDMMQRFYDDHQARAIGVSNFDDHDLANIIEHGDLNPAVDQIQYYIGATEPINAGFAQKNDVLVEAYSPLATGGLLDNADLRPFADKYGVSIAQLALRFVLQNGVLPLPKATSAAHIQANTQLDFEISADDMAKLNAMPDFSPDGAHNKTQR